MTHTISKHNIEYITVNDLAVSSWAISKFLVNELQQHDCSPFELVKRLSIHPNKKAAKQLVHWIVDGEGNRRFLGCLATALGKETEVEELLDRTSTQRQRRYQAEEWWQARRLREGFRPYITIHTIERWPRTIFVEAFLGGRYKEIPLPEELANKSFAQQEQAVKQFFFDYLEKHNGDCPNWGKVSGFSFVHSWNAYNRYSLEGAFIETVNKPLIPVHASLVWNSREITSFLHQIFI